MKTKLLFGWAICLSSLTIAQHSGNINYQNQVHFVDENINIGFLSENQMEISVKGLANVKADSYVAIFNVSQVGKTTEEVNTIINGRIKESLDKIKIKPGVETMVDMISFVPVYEFEMEKKVFSKKTYNEVPAGFELKKNIHIKYTDAEELNEIIAILAEAEIFDLIRVDYFTNSIETIKKEMMVKAKSLMLDKMKNYSSLLGQKMDSLDKNLVDGFKVVLPVEMYKSYQAFNSTSLNLKKSAQVNQHDKSTTLYYQPVLDKEFDFVMNPVILEPVIQVMYEIKIKIDMNEEQPVKGEKKFVLVTPNGDLKTLDIK